MPISGTLPFYDISTGVEQSPTTAPFTGAPFPSSGSASNVRSDETLQAFFRRAAGILGISGTADASGQIITSGAMSGLVHLQREVAARAVDIEVGPSAPNSVRLEKANALLAAAGEVQFGS